VSSLPEVLDEKLGCEVVIHEEYPRYGMTAEYLSAFAACFAAYWRCAD
jgi:hypothetical protein